MKTWSSGEKVLASDLNGNFSTVANLLTPTLLAAADVTAGQAVYASGYRAAAVTYDSRAGVGTTSGGTSQSFSITVGSNSNRALVVIVAMSGASCSGVTAGGVAMTQVASGNDGTIFYSSWVLFAPTTGSISVVASSSGFGFGFVMGMSFYNVDQSGIDSHVEHGQGGTSDSQTLSVQSPYVVAVSGSWCQPSNNQPFVSGNTNIGNNQNTYLAFAGTQFAGAMGNSNEFTGPGSQTVAMSWGSGTGSPHSGVVSVGLKAANIQGAVSPASASASSTANTFIGFATASFTAGNTGPVCIGGVVGGFTGLIIGTLYYLSNTAGQISSTAGSVTRKVGIAISSTQLLITNVW